MPAPLAAPRKTAKPTSAPHEVAHARRSGCLRRAASCARAGPSAVSSILSESMPTSRARRRAGTSPHPPSGTDGLRNSGRVRQCASQPVCTSTALPRTSNRRERACALRAPSCRSRARRPHRARRVGRARNRRHPARPRSDGTDCRCRCRCWPTISMRPIWNSVPGA